MPVFRIFFMRPIKWTNTFFGTFNPVSYGQAYNFKAESYKPGKS